MTRAVRPSRGRGLSRRPHTARGGMSILEVVAAVAILALVTATVTLAINYMVATNARERRRLAATEMANRLILQYLDDKTKMPSTSLPIPYATDEFMYSIRETRVTLEENRRARERASSQRGGVSRDRIKQVTVRVWLHKDSQGREYAADVAPSATLSRLYDPLNISRNPDSAGNTIQNEENLRDLINNVLGGGQTP